MSKPRKPTNVLELSGAFKKNPKRGRKRANEPTPADGIGSPPTHLCDASKAAWKELVKICVPGVLTRSDRFIVEITANLLTEYRRSPDDFLTSRMTQLRGALSQLGLNPVDRSKVGVFPNKPEEPNPFANL